MSNIRFTMKDLDGTVMPYTSFVISTSTSANAASFTTNLNGQATVSLSAVSTPYYISKQDGTTESVIAYKFFVPDTTYTIDTELLFVDMGKISKDKNDKSIAALIEAKVVAVNAANRALQVVSLLGDVSTIRNNLDSLVQVASSIENVVTVANNIESIVSASEGIASISSILPYTANIATVANRIEPLVAVGNNINNINDVRAMESDIAAIADNIASITDAAAAVTQAVDAQKDLYIAGTHYTKGVSATLNLSYTPAKTKSVKVFFDGIYQNKNTFTRVGTAITFNEVLNVDTVEIHYEVPSQFVALDDGDNAVLVAAQNAAQASANAAAASFDSFDDRYLGAKTVAPTLDNDGNVLLVGAKYFNSTNNKMYVRNVSNAWQLDTADSSTVNYDTDGQTVQGVLDNIKSLPDYAALRLYSGRATTVRITTPGKSGFFRRNGSAVDNGGTVIVDASARSWERVFDGPAQASWFEFGFNGTTDDSAQFKKAIEAGAPLEMKGETITIISAVTIAAPITIFGRGTILFKCTSLNAISCAYDVDIRGDIVMDGTGVTNRMVLASGGRLILSVKTIKNAFQVSSSGVCPIVAVGVDYVRIYDNEFDNISTPKDNEIGNSNGAVEAVMINGSCKSGKIFRNKFKNINNRATYNGTLEFEDADAILCAAGVARQNVHVFDNEFENCGKRFFKCDGTTDSVYRFTGNDLAISYTGTADNDLDIGNGMYSAVSCYGGHIFAKDNTLIGGVISQFLDCDYTKFSSAIVTDNIYSPEIHTYVNKSRTRFVNVGIHVNADARLTVTGNYITNSYFGIVSNAKLNNIQSNTRIETGGVGISLEAGGTFNISGNVISQSAVWSAGTEYAYGVLIGDNVKSGSGTGNTFVGKYDGWNVSSQSAACRMAFASNAYQSLVRNDITNSAASTYVNHFANAGSTTALYSSISAQTATYATAGAAAALPATPAGYERVIINGVSAKIPYYPV